MFGDAAEAAFNKHRDETVLAGARVLLYRGRGWDDWLVGPDQPPSRLRALLGDWSRCQSGYWTDTVDHVDARTGRTTLREIIRRHDRCDRPGCPTCALHSAEYALRPVGPVVFAAYGETAPLCVRLTTRRWGPRKTREQLSRLFHLQERTNRALQQAVRGILGVITIEHDGCNVLLLIRRADQDHLLAIRRAWARIAGGATRIERLPYDCLPFGDRQHNLTIAERALVALHAEAAWSPYTAAAQHPDAAIDIRAWLDERHGGALRDDSEPRVQLLVRGPGVEQARQYLRSTDTQARLLTALERLARAGTQAVHEVTAEVDQVQRTAMGWPGSGGDEPPELTAEGHPAVHVQRDPVEAMSGLVNRIARLRTPRPQRGRKAEGSAPSPVEPPARSEPQSCLTCGSAHCQRVFKPRVPWRTALRRPEPGWIQEEMPVSDLRPAGGWVLRPGPGGGAP